VAAPFANREPRRVSHLVLYGARASALTHQETWAPLRALLLANWPLAVRSIAAVTASGGEQVDIRAFEALRHCTRPIRAGRTLGSEYASTPASNTHSSFRVGEARSQSRRSRPALGASGGSHRNTA